MSKENKIELTQDELDAKLEEATRKAADDAADDAIKLAEDEIKKAKEDGIALGKAGKESKDAPIERDTVADIKNNGLNLLDKVETIWKKDAHGKRKGDKVVMHPLDADLLYNQGFILKETKKLKRVSGQDKSPI